MIIWLSGKKRYGYMAIYLTTEADVQALLSRRIVHVRGEAAFSDRFYERQRPLRCRKVNSKTGAQTPRPAASARAMRPMDSPRDI
ncbi:hypothetical protein N7505_007595 [Penicillium chrysogenum]|uniref:Uncharacterized protein n=1 Tax=Penicillium chrysogenum TaxID=5076 RepID=A0ABQ8WDT9_PENCH|nr:hypothetical protein N7505_007595 [Penicillium chrysogenum]